jgi:hypothetical protein
VTRADAVPNWVEDADCFGLHLATLAVSFQRFRRHNSGKVTEAPSSLGALPVAAVGNGHFLLPLADDEAFWIGLSADEGGTFSVSIDVQSRDGQVKLVTPVPVHIPPDCWLAGLPRDRGYDVFSRGNDKAKTAIAILSMTARMTVGSADVMRIAEVELVDYATFTERTDRAAPEGLDPDAGYKGYRLP